MITYKFKWEPSGSWFMSSADHRPRLEFQYQCSICQRKIPKKSTAIIVEARDVNVFTHRLCVDCVAAITKENLRAFDVTDDAKQQLD